MTLCLVRRVVAVEGDTVFVCTEEEYTSASRESREPKCIGFNRKYVVSRAPKASVANT